MYEKHSMHADLPKYFWTVIYPSTVYGHLTVAKVFSLRYNNGIWRHKTWSTLVQVVVSCTKPLLSNHLRFRDINRSAYSQQNYSYW